MKKKIPISRKLLLDLYINQDFTAADLAKKFNCSDVTILNRLHQYKIKTKPKGRRKFLYKKYSFNGDNVEKAYLLGFRIGDLNVYRPNNKNSRIIVVRCHTTLSDQIDLLKFLFGKYGQVTISQNKYGDSYHVNCYMDQSFNFLLNKKLIPAWISDNLKTSWAFIAGYVDAEGSFGLNQGRGRFKIDSYDYHVLSWMKKFLDSQRINNKFWRIYKKGESIKWEIKTRAWNDDLWRLNINEANSLENFIETIGPYILHKKRKKDADFILNNIFERRRNGTI